MDQNLYFVLFPITLIGLYILNENSKKQQPLPPVPSEEYQLVSYNLSLIKDWSIEVGEDYNHNKKLVIFTNGNIQVLTNGSVWKMSDLSTRQEVYSFVGEENPIKDALIEKYQEALLEKEKEELNIQKQEEELKKQNRLKIFNAPEFKKATLMNKINNMK